jgi:hypothetical protein
MVDFGSVLLIGAAIFTGFALGLGILAIACVLIGKGFKRRHEHKFERTIAETPDEVFLKAIREYEGA